MTTRSHYFATPAFRGLFVALCVVFVVLMGLSFNFIEQEHEAVVQLELETRADQMARSTAESLRLSVENLQAASSILLFLENVSYSQFKALTDRYFASDPGLLILEWQPVVTGDEREQFEQNARALGLLDFRFWEPDENGEPVTAPYRSEHVPVYFMRSRTPEADDINTLGLDLAWSPERMESKWKARDDGRAISSGFFPVVLGPTESSSPLGFAITLPLYGDGLIPDSEEGRQSRLIGYLAGVYSVQLLLDQQISALRNVGINVEIYNSPESENRLVASEGNNSSFSREIQSTLFGATWHIHLTATEDFVKQWSNPVYYLLPAGLMLLFAVTALFLFLQERSRIRLSDAHIKLQEANRQLTELSRHDPLTGLLNRRAFLDRAEQILNELNRYPRPTALLMIDLDKFKSINDQWGHPTGDKVLQAFASTCEATVRSVDAIGRLGGEEFAILLPQSDAEDASNLSERLRKTLSEQTVLTDKPGESVSFTASIGFSVINKPIKLKTWLAQADQALYASKDEGRNRVTEYQVVINS